jgi:hypothetical protein
MAAVPGYRHDVFVSYAHSDNLPVAGSRTGFVSQLVSDLKTEIGRKVSKSLDIWWDHYSLAGNVAVTPEIMSAASDCASVIVIVSPAYLRSEWCGQERDAFFRVVGRASSQAVFIVSLEPIDHCKLPPTLKDYRGYEFYRALGDGRTTRPLRTEISSDVEPYNDRLSQLVQNVSDHLERLATEPAARVVTTAPPDPSKPAVLVLEVTDDLVQRRAELKEYLEQLGISVLPEKRYSRDDMTLQRQQMLADLARSRACVQILGPLVGDRSDHPRGMTWLRSDMITGACSPVPFLQWRDPDLDMHSVADADARELLTPSSVHTERFPDFRRAVGELALRPPRAEPTRTNAMSVFVNSDVLDRELGVSVAEWLASHGFMVLEPPQSTSDAREEWETNLRYCDSVLLMYGQSKPGWVRTQILLSNKVKRESPLKLLGICVAPPRPDPARDKTEDLALRYAGIHYVRNEDSLLPNPTELQRFAEKLLNAHASF